MIRGRYRRNTRAIQAQYTARDTVLSASLLRLLPRPLAPHTSRGEGGGSCRGWGWGVCRGRGSLLPLPLPPALSQVSRQAGSPPIGGVESARPGGAGTGPAYRPNTSILPATGSPLGFLCSGVRTSIRFSLFSNPLRFSLNSGR